MYFPHLCIMLSIQACVNLLAHRQGARSPFQHPSAPAAAPPPKLALREGGLRIPTVTNSECVLTSKCKRVFGNAHTYHINSVSVNTDQARDCGPKPRFAPPSCCLSCPFERPDAGRLPSPFHAGDSRVSLLDRTAVRSCLCCASLATVCVCAFPYASQRNATTHQAPQETFLSADDLRINLWNLEVSNQSFNMLDIKPPNMEDLTEVRAHGTSLTNRALRVDCKPSQCVTGHLWWR